MGACGKFSYKDAAACFSNVVFEGVGSLTNESFLTMKNKVSIIKKRISPENSLTVSTSEAADLLGVCPRTVSNLTKRGELPVVKIAGCVRYCRQALIDFVQQKTVRESGESAA